MPYGCLICVSAKTISNYDLILVRIHPHSTSSRWKRQEARIHPRRKSIPGSPGSSQGPPREPAEAPGAGNQAKGPPGSPGSCQGASREPPGTRGLQRASTVQGVSRGPPGSRGSSQAPPGSPQDAEAPARRPRDARATPALSERSFRCLGP